jgi:hypothetical protein
MGSAKCDVRGGKSRWGPFWRQSLRLLVSLHRHNFETTCSRLRFNFIRKVHSLHLSAFWLYPESGTTYVVEHTKERFEYTRPVLNPRLEAREMTAERPDLST